MIALALFDPRNRDLLALCCAFFAALVLIGVPFAFSLIDEIEDKENQK